MSKLTPDLNELIFAWEDEAPDNAWYFDIQTGNLQLVNRNLLELRDLTDEIERYRERYLYMPKGDRAQMILDLKEFWSTVKDDKLRNVLSIAFESPHVLAAFKKILESHHEELTRLEKYRRDKTQLRIAEWLNSHAIKFDFKE